jgi:hypothetical protein
MPSKQQPDPTKPNKCGGVRLSEFKPHVAMDVASHKQAVESKDFTNNKPATEAKDNPKVQPANSRRMILPVAKNHLPPSEQVHVVKLRIPTEITPVTDNATLAMIEAATQQNEVQLSGDVQTMRAQINSLLDDLK